VYSNLLSQQQQQCASQLLLHSQRYIMQQPQP
jgi:hypothetical protein